MGIRRVVGLTWNRLLMRVDNSAGEGTFGMDKCGWQNEHEAWLSLQSKPSIKTCDC